jgi:hypothetical protein
MTAFRGNFRPCTAVIICESTTLRTMIVRARDLDPLASAASTAAPNAAATNSTTPTM